MRFPVQPLVFTLAGLLVRVVLGQNSVQYPLTNNVSVQDVTALPFFSAQWNNQLQQDRLTQAFRDAMLLANGALANIQTNNLATFKKYFPEDGKAQVITVLQSIIGTLGDRTSGNDRLANVNFANFDYSGLCDPDDTPRPGTIMMYTSSSYGPVNQPSFIFVCPLVWTLGYNNMADITCKDTCPKLPCYFSYEMISLGEMVFHELVHRTSSLTPELTGFKDPILDMETTIDGKKVYIYGSYYTQQAMKKWLKPDTVYNADSYSMFARELYWTQRCNTLVYNNPTTHVSDPRVNPTPVDAQKN